MRVSVIIPVKNRADLLPRTLTNILEQTLRPYEVFVIDDGSTDHIDKVKQEFHGKVTFLKNSGTGPGAARNEGFKAATGDYIQFFDSDDLMTKNKLEMQAKLLHDASADFVYGPYVKATELAGTWKRKDAIMQYHPLPDQNLSDLVLEGWCLLTQSTLFNRRFLDKVGLWRTDLMPHEDREFWFRIGKAATKYCHEHESCVIYRQHGNQITDSAISNQNRTLDGIKAADIIGLSKDKKNALHSSVLFMGQRAGAKSFFNRQFKDAAPFSLKFSEKLAYIYYALNLRIDRTITRNGWQRMHGAFHSDQVFNDYIKMI